MIEGVVPADSKSSNHSTAQKILRKYFSSCMDEKRSTKMRSEYYAFWRMSHYTLKKKTKDQQQQQQCQAAAQPKECRFTLTLRTINQQPPPPPPPPQQHHPAADHSGDRGGERQVQQQHSMHSSSTLVDSIRKVERYGSNGLYSTTTR